MICLQGEFCVLDVVDELLSYPSGCQSLFLKDRVSLLCIVERAWGKSYRAAIARGVSLKQDCYQSILASIYSNHTPLARVVVCQHIGRGEFLLDLLKCSFLRLTPQKLITLSEQLTEWLVYACQLWNELCQLVDHPIDPYHAAAIMDLKRGSTGINNTHAIFRMHNLFWVHCLCPSSLVLNPKWRLRDEGLLNLWSSLTLVGCGNSHTALVFSESASTPLSEMTWPRNVILRFENSHL